MAEGSSVTQPWYITHVIISIIVLLQVSYTESYRPHKELNPLNLFKPALDDSYTIEDTRPLEDGFQDIQDDIMPTDKRYARLSYSYSNSGRGRNYYNSRYYANYYKPWLNLPDKECFRDKCSSDRDCCRRYSKCDVSAKVCYNCWYGHPCRTSRDCCERYPYCSRHSGTCQG